MHRVCAVPRGCPGPEVRDDHELSCGSNLGTLEEQSAFLTLSLLYGLFVFFETGSHIVQADFEFLILLSLCLSHVGINARPKLMAFCMLGKLYQLS